jgi:hypothetical protein
MFLDSLGTPGRDILADCDEWKQWQVPFLYLRFIYRLGIIQSLKHFKLKQIVKVLLFNFFS